MAVRLSRHDCDGNNAKLFELCVSKTDGPSDTAFREESNLPYNLFLVTKKDGLKDSS